MTACMVGALCKRSGIALVIIFQVNSAEALDKKFGIRESWLVMLQNSQGGIIFGVVTLTKERLNANIRTKKTAF